MEQPNWSDEEAKIVELCVATIEAMHSIEVDKLEFMLQRLEFCEGILSPVLPDTANMARIVRREFTFLLCCCKELAEYRAGEKEIFEAQSKFYKETKGHEP